jgi:hypothetical protein
MSYEEEDTCMSYEELWKARGEEEDTYDLEAAGDTRCCLGCSHSGGGCLLLQQYLTQRFNGGCLILGF